MKTRNRDTFPKPNRTSSTNRHTLWLPDGSPHFSSTHNTDPGHPPIETDFVELGDGRIAELVEDPTDPSHTQLAVWKDGTIRYASKVESHGRVFVPLRRQGQLLREVLLPSSAEAYGSILDLVGEVGAIMLYTLSLSHLDRAVLSTFVLYTWVADALPIAVYLSVFGPPQSGKTTLLQVLQLLCRRPLLTSDISSAAFYGACDRLKPTLLLDEWEAGSTLRRLLRAGHTRASALVVRRNQSYNVFGPKVISSLEPLEDVALNSRCILFPMTQTSSPKLIKPSDPRLLKLAGGIRKRLFQFRLERIGRIRPARVAGAEHLRPRDQDLLNSLAAPIAHYEEWCQGLCEFFKLQSCSKEKTLSATHRTVLEVLFLLAHTGASGIIVKDCADLVNAELCGKGEPYGLSARKVGFLLTSLGFSSREPTNKGSKLLLDKADQWRIHKLVKHHRIELPKDVPLRIRMGHCPMCLEMGLC
jgi:hypothetical protein